MNMKKKILFICFLLSLIVGKAQVSLSYLPLSSYVGISSNPNLRAWVDFRLLTNTFFSNSNMEVLPMINIKKDSLIKCYIGVGLNFNVVYGLYNDGRRYVNGYALAFGVRVSPFRSSRNLSFIAEVSPYANETFSGGSFRTNLGVAWRFKRKKAS